MLRAAAAAAARKLSFSFSTTAATVGTREGGRPIRLCRRSTRSGSCFSARTPSSGLGIGSSRGRSSTSSSSGSAAPGSIVMRRRGASLFALLALTLVLVLSNTLVRTSAFRMPAVQRRGSRKGSSEDAKGGGTVVSRPEGLVGAAEPLLRRRSSGHLGLLVVPESRRMIRTLKCSAGDDEDEGGDDGETDRAEVDYFSRRTIDPYREAVRWEKAGAGPMKGRHQASTVPYGLDEESTEECVQIPHGYSVGMAVAYIQKVARSPSREHILRTHDRIYVTKEGGILCGYIAMSDLITNEPDTPVDNIVQEPEEIMREGEFWEEASRRLRNAAISAAPVVDKEGYLVAVMSPMDLLDEMEEEATEDFLKFSGAGGLGGEVQGGYFETPLLKQVFNRVSWLVSLLMLQSLSSIILTYYQAVLERHIVIALFLTMLTGTAGNAGNQSSAMVIRGLATGEITRANSRACFARETKAALMSAVILSAASFVRVWLTPGATMISTIAVSFAMGATVVGSVLFGTAAPLVLDRLGIDPVSVASPALATITDVSGVLILCLTAKVLLGG